MKFIQLGRKNIRLLVAGENTEGLALLPLGRVRRQGSGQFVFDDRFVPPTLQISAAPPLMAMLRRLIALLER